MRPSHNGNAAELTTEATVTRQEILFRQLATLRRGYIRGRTTLLLICLACLLAFLDDASYDARANADLHVGDSGT